MRWARKATGVMLGLIIGLGVGTVVGQMFQTHDPWAAPLGGHLTTMGSGSGLIAFISTRKGGWDIWVMRADGAFPTRLTFDGEWKSRPQISYDGRWILYTSDPNRDSLNDVFVCGIDGSNLTQVTDAAAFGHNYGYAAWHPNNRAIVLDDFETERLFIIDVTDPPYRGASAPVPVGPLAPSSSTAGYIDELGDVGPGGMVVLDATNDDFWEAHSLLVDDASHLMVYARGDACYQCGIDRSCGIGNFPITVALSSNPAAHVKIRTTQQLVSPSFFGTAWSGSTGHLQLAIGDRDYEDNCGSYTVWMIPYPTGE